MFKNRLMYMKFEVWEQEYNKILSDFGFFKEDDEESAIILNEILKKESFYSFNSLKAFVDESTDVNTVFVIFGAGPSLKKHTIKFKKMLNDSKAFQNYFVIAADGATSSLLEEGIIPEVIATDLDGNMDDLLTANDKGSIFVIHAHGNNKELISKYTAEFTRSIGTTQSKPFDNLYNFGGFTDGDRAVFLAVELNANKILLGGMDFGKYVTKYSRPDINSDIDLADEIKQKKLKYAEKLINWISDNEKVKIEYME